MDFFSAERSEIALAARRSVSPGGVACEQQLCAWLSNAALWVPHTIPSSSTILIVPLGAAKVAQCRASALAVEEDLDVLEDAQPGFRAGRVVVVVNQFLLQKAKKALHRVIVSAPA